jgi:hypothetical protein
MHAWLLCTQHMHNCTAAATRVFSSGHQNLSEPQSHSQHPFARACCKGNLTDLIKQAVPPHSSCCCCCCCVFSPNRCQILLCLHTKGQAPDQVEQRGAGQHPEDARQVWVGQHTQQVAEDLQGQGQATSWQLRQTEQAMCLMGALVAVHQVGDAVHDGLQGVLRHVDVVLLQPRGLGHRQ